MVANWFICLLFNDIIVTAKDIVHKNEMICW